MVSIANGNLPSAIFNASISSLIGVAVTPLWIGLIIASDGSTSNGLSIDLSDSIIKLSLQVLLPLFLGVLLHSRYGAIALRHKEALKLFDQSVIILIVYISFCESFAHNMFKDSSWWQLVWLSVAMVALFFLIYGVVLLIGRVLKFSREDKITALFCGSKKSLVHGTVMAKVLFPKVAGVGVILLPLMIFHTLQLVIASIIARSFAKKVAAV